MIDEYVNKGKVAASVAWAVVVGLMLVGWVIILLAPGQWRIGCMFSATACATAAFAATLHIRCYAVRVACLVRASNSVGPPGGPRPVRDGH